MVCIERMNAKKRQKIGGIVIRRASSRDWTSIRALIARFPDVLIQDHVPRASSFFIALDGDTIIGCCALEAHSRRLAEIRSLAVNPDYRGRGIASALIERCVERAKERHIYEILSITGAATLFEKQGFHPFHKEKYALFRVLD